MNLNLVDNFNKACELAKAISEFPALSEEEYGRIFEHVSNGDMETTIRTIVHAYNMIQKEQVLKTVEKSQNENSNSSRSAIA